MRGRKGSSRPGRKRRHSGGRVLSDGWVRLLLAELVSPSSRPRRSERISPGRIDTRMGVSIA